MPFALKESVENEVYIKELFTFNEPIVWCDKETKKVHYSIELRYGQVKNIMFVLEQLYYAYYDQELLVEFSKMRFQIQDMILHKMILQRARELDDEAWNRSNLLCRLVEDNQITSLDKLRDISNIPFSGMMRYDEYDYSVNKGDELACFIRMKSGCRCEQESEVWIVEHVNECVNSNRYINKKMEISHCKVTKFENCYIEGNLKISTSDEVIIFNCIVTGKIVCTDVAELQIIESNVFHFLMYNSNVTKCRVAISKIYRLEIHNCFIDKWDVYDNIFEQSYFGELSLPDKKIDIEQFKSKNIRPGIIKEVRRCPREKFYLSYQLKKVSNRKISSQYITLQTVETLLDNGDFRRNYAAKGDLQYKKILYANRGIKKAYIFLTGGFYKPYRWVIYIAVTAFMFSLLYWKVTAGFVDSESGIIVELDFCKALQYSFSQLVNIDLMKLNGKGVCQGATIVQKALNTVFIADFFASVIKRYMD